MTLDESRELAKQIVKGKYFLPPVKVMDLATEAGFTVYGVDFKELNAFMSPEEKIIYVQMSDTDQQKRFSIAYELALWYNYNEEILKNDLLTKFIRKSALEPRNVMETICYQFAADILIPDDLLSRYKTDNSISKLAELFHVEVSVVCDKN
jgi:Zn-dependent peptidase ImmA (M78 family)